MSTANFLSAHEEFNTHYASLKGWEEAVRLPGPTLRQAAQFSLTTIVLGGNARTADQGSGRRAGRAAAVGPARSRDAQPRR